MGKKIDSIDHDLINFVYRLSFVPCLVPNQLHKFNKKIVERYLKKLKPKLLIISGGGSKKKDDRFHTELFLIKYSIKKRIPIFGICRGMQMLSAFFNCDIKKVKGHVAKKHKIIYEYKNSVTIRKVNSFHNYSIKKLPREFKEIGTSSDGEIEAIFNKRLLLWNNVASRKRKNN